MTLKFSVAAIAFILGAWLAFDGSRALIVGDYITPRSGVSAGQLGPWSRVVSALRLEPRSTLVKCLHIVLGVGWLAAAACFLVGHAAGWIALLITSIGTLWYLPIGTVLSLAEIILLFLPSIRAVK